MQDIRDYRSTILSAVAEERERDRIWSWRVIAITKKEARIGWGYLDYIGEDTPFTVTIIDDEDLSVVVGWIPNGTKKYAFIGPDHWDDAPSFSKGIAQVIHAMAASAHNTY